MVRPGPLLRLVNTLERRRAARTFSLEMRLVHVKSRAVLASIEETHSGPRAFVMAAGERAHLTLSPHLLGDTLARHIAVIVEPHSNAAYLRAVSLHPDRPVRVLPFGTDPPAGSTDAFHGGGLSRTAMRLYFDGLALDVRAHLVDATTTTDAPGDIFETFPLGSQLAFFAGAAPRPVSDAFSSITGPATGGHAIPALVKSGEGEAIPGGGLLLRTRDGVHRVDVSYEELRRGVLVGRSRRCVLGRGFDENDGLSRVHALVLGIDDGVMAFDLASRYGLRDVSRPNQSVDAARLDDGLGCLVYGAGLLTFERV